jgi:small ligand-binding sensory domain FIST
MTHVSTSTKLACAASLSAHVDPSMAAEVVCEEITGAMAPGTVDLLVAFASGDHVDDLATIAGRLRRDLAPGALLAVSGEGVVGGDEEVERRPALSVFAASLPGATLHPFTYQELPHAEPDDPAALADLAERIGASGDHRATLFFADPFSVPVASAVASLSAAGEAAPGLKRFPVLGGVASASTNPGRNVLTLNEQSFRTGGVGVTISGDVEIDSLVSQGCRPVGTPMLVTKGRRNVLQQLGGRRALDVLRDVVDELDEAERELVSNGMFIGRVVDEYKPRFGRGDFLVRAVLGVDQGSGAIAVGDQVRVGQTVQFHLRDARTADEDLQLLLSAQKLRRPPAGAMLFTCNGRGTRLFAGPHHDARAVRAALVDDHGAPPPLAGFFAAGEIGPIGDRSYVHGHTACAAMFRPARPSGVIGA